MGFDNFCVNIFSGRLYLRFHYCFSAKCIAWRHCCCRSTISFKKLESQRLSSESLQKPKIVTYPPTNHCLIRKQSLILGYRMVIGKSKCDFVQLVPGFLPLTLYVLVTTLCIFLAQSVPLHVLPTACSANEAERPIPKYVQRSYDEDPHLQLAGNPGPVFMPFRDSRAATVATVTPARPTATASSVYKASCPCRYRTSREKALQDCSHPGFKTSCDVMSLQTASNVKKYRCCFPSSRMLRIN